VKKKVKGNEVERKKKKDKRRKNKSSEKALKLVNHHS
jgi:hypothetical protein